MYLTAINIHIIPNGIRGMKLRDYRVFDTRAY